MTQRNPCTYTGWHLPLDVTLTGTTNQYLTERLPLRGKLAVRETGTHGRIIYANFSITDPDTGKQGPYVWAPDPEFTYSRKDTP